MNAGSSPRKAPRRTRRHPISAAAARPKSTLPYSAGAISASFRAHLQAWLQGNPSPVLGNCAGSNQGNGILRGYVTVDTVNACNLLFPSVNLQHPATAYADPYAQMWVTTMMDLSGPFAGVYTAGFPGIQLDNANAPNTSRIPFP